MGYAAQNQLPPLQAAEQIGALCKQLGLQILSLNPLKNFEGNLTVPLAERLAQAAEWVDLAAAAGAHSVQVPSQFAPHSTGDFAVIVPELRALADLAAARGVGVAYEAVAFAAHHATWQDSLRIAAAVGRAGFGLCLDSYHIHARLWGDPCAADGRRPGGERAVRDSMAEFLASCPRETVRYVQLSDASRLDPPLTDDSPLFDGLEVRDPRLAWSRSARPFPLEAPGYLPVVDIARTWLIDYGWDQWVSLEGFLAETEREENGPEVMAERARKSIDELYKRL
ncbi:unnamed protein product [Mycena citricolor]|uniref:Xylose isomerase-like TIM barrel domain-containing protein n=1 Tax=Mycena citricolor TaxID=2018698 RepID=A0AAD2HC82_9AGAR|nr:unnamed protein product [Mycena citricolor]